MKELICIVCPNGCRLRVDAEKNLSVTGNGCPRGEAYGKTELTCPVRVVTSTVRCRGANHPRCPVKTDAPVPKGQMKAVLAALNSVTVEAPLRRGTVILENVCGTGANVVTTRSL